MTDALHIFLSPQNSTRHINVAFQRRCGCAAVAEASPKKLSAQFRGAYTPSLFLTEAASICTEKIKPDQEVRFSKLNTMCRLQMVYHIKKDTIELRSPQNQSKSTKRSSSSPGGVWSCEPRCCPTTTHLCLVESRGQPIPDSLPCVVP